MFGCLHHASLYRGSTAGHVLGFVGLSYMGSRLCVADNIAIFPMHNLKNTQSKFFKTATVLKACCNFIKREFLSTLHIRVFFLMCLGLLFLQY